jgi:hypothetical protein
MATVVMRFRLENFCLPAGHISLWMYRKCIVQARDTDVYVALSYVWGSCDQLKTVRNNLHYLMEWNSLEGAAWASKIPRTIREGMSFLGKLGERYLWVDSP